MKGLSERQIGGKQSADKPHHCNRNQDSGDSTKTAQQNALREKLAYQPQPPAPSVRRRASSLILFTDRTSSRLATFAQAMSSTSAVAQNKTTTTGPVFPATAS